jgi:hypothetical protein
VPSFIAAVALQQLRDMEDIRRDLGPKRRRRRRPAAATEASRPVVALPSPDSTLHTAQPQPMTDGQRQAVAAAPGGQAARRREHAGAR